MGIPLYLFGALDCRNKNSLRIYLMENSNNICQNRIIFTLCSGIGRRNAPPLGLPSTLEDSAAGWKSGPGSSVSDNQGNSFGGPVSVFPNAVSGQSSPAGGQFQGVPPPGSSTPQVRQTTEIHNIPLLDDR